MTVKKVLKKIIRNWIEYEFPTNWWGWGGSDLDIGWVSAIVDMKLWDYNSLFSITSWLYKILNAIDTDDEIWLTSWESWSQIVSSATSMSKISHCYAVMCYIANSSVAMNQIVWNSSATKEISECWNSITIIAENQLSSDIYLWSVNWLTNLFTYQTAQDAFFTSTERKTEIISDNIMVIVNNNTLLTNINDDPVVEVVIASSEEAMLAIVASTDKLDIVDENSVIMTWIATNASALTAMSDQNFTSYILEDHDYLVACTSDDDWKARINSMAADDLLPAIFYWTWLSGYSTFADLAANDSAMEIVQSNTESMLIIESNDEASQYIWYQVNSNTLSYFPFKDDLLDVTWNRTITPSNVNVSDWAVNITSANSYMLLNNAVWWSEITASVRYYYWWYNTTWEWNTLLCRNTWTYHHVLIPWRNNTPWTVWFYNSNWYPWNKVITPWKRYHIVVVKNWNNEKIYVDKELVIDSNSSFNNNSYPISIIGNYTSNWPTQWALWKMSDLIFESWSWTLDQITSYYKKTTNKHKNSS